MDLADERRQSVPAQEACTGSWRWGAVGQEVWNQCPFAMVSRMCGAKCAVFTNIIKTDPMPEHLPRSSPLQKSRSRSFYAVVAFAVTLFVVGGVYLALTLYRHTRIYPTRPGAAPARVPSARAKEFKPVPATFDGIGWRIEAEDYDEGGEGVGWHDLFPGNILYEFNPPLKRPGLYRDDDVEIMSKNPGQLNVGFILKGEWLAYTMDVPETGMYNLDLNVAAMHPDRRIYFELDGKRLPETVTLPVTGDWASFQVVTMPGGVELTKGKHRLKMVFDESFMNVDWLRLTPLSTAGSGRPKR